jgi:hypothetical protein
MSITSIRNWAVLIPCLVACGSAPAAGEKPRSAAATEASNSSTETVREAPLDPKQALGTADGIYRDQLAVGARDDRFATDRQVAELRKAVALYQQFIERAAGDPRYAEAVRRSEGRIDDAEKTIEFLLAGDRATNAE